MMGPSPHHGASVTSTSLSHRLRTETRALHASAERSAFMSVLLRGRMQRDAYSALLRNLHPIYAAMEPELARHSKHPVIAPVYLPALWRTGALERDLVVLHGAAWRDEIEPQAVTARYVDRLRAGGPETLLSHAYVRYLGDLSGGQMLRDIVARSMNLTNGDGAEFYDFGDPAQTRALTESFRKGLQSIALDDAGIDAVVEEAKLAFEMHRSLFDGLAHASGLVDRDLSAT
jgi:heme oxygenase